ncbi:CDP-glucose 4,6-dehydratase [Cupriavidus consociatus]|uniref:CDP-glucose 4,6-dehydratase n=1 Tax=Cupriavidus consociatus TaxID=2821357 RepID=UPI001AE690E4|nr:MULTISPECIES: CDP-glucose 4,6-dehydratase [unclassified Cupriavidus]MBP0621442.1 CDP-glucose 4,6-dehydratase [Cupriavidus sp. LEh25]MDK2658115.1 CDP-glucose 4,6-dehydratase [Cupriavidus sp. LEh21]
MIQFGDVYRGRRVLLTGHTGFKGSWLALWLSRLGADVTGIALAPETVPNHWDLLGLDMASHLIDIRDKETLARVIAQTQPELVLHLAAQPLVRRSYREPIDTWAVNVMGTANVLECCRQISSVRGILVVTSDKCYENQEWAWGYRENDRLGGHDPYSASKAATELVVSSYRDSFFQADGVAALASARAGNVIGGGDWSEDRLIPDIVRAVGNHAEVEIRSPRATRPWQHVLESLSGYLLLGQRLLGGQKDVAAAWNFGPEAEGNRPVQAVMERIAVLWPELRWHVARNDGAHEAQLLYLDSAKARAGLNWRPVWGFDAALAATATWYRSFLADGTVLSEHQLDQYVQAAGNAGVAWCQP